jgi:SPP1 gp7 family putative phage head morphogenesis protein
MVAVRSGAKRRLLKAKQRDVAGIELAGIITAKRLAVRTTMAGVEAYRRGEEPGPYVRQVMLAASEDLITAAVAGVLAAFHRATLLANRKSDILVLSVLDDAVSVLKRRLSLKDDQIAGLREAYGVQAVTVMDTASKAVDRKIQRAMVEITEQNLHVAGGVDKLYTAFRKAGVSPQNTFQLEAIFRTQTQMAYGAAQWQANQSAIMQSLLWGYEYATVGDDRVRPEHQALDRVSLPKEDPFWTTAWTPNGWACRCVVLEVFEPQEVLRPLPVTEIDGKAVVPGPDPGFGFNPGMVNLHLERMIKDPLPSAPKYVPLPDTTTLSPASEPGPTRLMPEPLAPKPPKPKLAPAAPELPSEWVEQTLLTKAKKALTNALSDGKRANFVQLIGFTDKARKLEVINGLGREVTRLRSEFGLLDDLLGSKKVVTRGMKRLELHDFQYLPPTPKTSRAMGVWYNHSKVMHIATERPMRGMVVAYKAHNVGNDIHAVLRHELGHTVHYRMKAKDWRKWQAIYDSRSPEAWHSISTYAGTNSKELFSECFAAWTHPNYGTIRHAGRIKLPDVIEKFFDKYIGRPKSGSAKGTLISKVGPKVKAKVAATKATKATKAPKPKPKYTTDVHQGMTEVELREVMTKKMNAARLTESEVEAVLDWTGGMSQEIRAIQLGKIYDPDPEISRALRLLKSAYNKVPKYQGDVWRGLQARGTRRKLEEQFRPGSAYTSRAFSSWSRHEAKAQGFLGTTKVTNRANVLLKYEDGKGAAIELLSDQEEELEVLMRSGLRGTIKKAEWKMGLHHQEYLEVVIQAFP